MTKEYDCMKKKNIIAICAALVILGMAIVLVLTENRGNVSNVNRVVGYSALYGENSINEAFDVIEKKFAKDLKVVHLLNFAMTRMLKTDLQKKLRSIEKKIIKNLLWYYQPLIRTKKAEMVGSILMIHTPTGNGI